MTACHTVTCHKIGPAWVSQLVFEPEAVLANQRAGMRIVGKPLEEQVALRLVTDSCEVAMGHLGVLGSRGHGGLCAAGKRFFMIDNAMVTSLIFFCAEQYLVLPVYPEYGVTEYSEGLRCPLVQYSRKLSKPGEREEGEEDLYLA